MMLNVMKLICLVDGKSSSLDLSPTGGRRQVTGDRLRLLVKFASHALFNGPPPVSTHFIDIYSHLPLPFCTYYHSFNGTSFDNFDIRRTMNFGFLQVPVMFSKPVGTPEISTIIPWCQTSPSFPFFYVRIPFWLSRFNFYLKSFLLYLNINVSNILSKNA